MSLHQTELPLIRQCDVAMANSAAMATRPVERHAKHEPKIILTDEQKNILSQPPTKNMRIKAFAGCAKTSTLVKYAEKYPQKGLYLAFNAAIAAEAREKFPPNITCQTAHAYAYKVLGMGAYQAQNRIRSRLLPEDLAPWFHMVMPIGNLSLRQMQSLVARTIGKWCNTDSADIEPWMVPDRNPYAARAIASLATDISIELLQWENHRQPITHDLYLKRFALLNGIGSEFEYVMIDEAQDTNGILLQILQNSKRPIIAVGDPYQSIYGFRGAIDGLDKIKGNDFPLTTSWRFGSEIAALANIVLSHHGRRPKLEVRGNPNKKGEVLEYAGKAPAGTCFIARTNARLFAGLIDLDRPFHVVGGAEEMFGQILSAYHLYRQLPDKKPDPFIKRFKTWGELIVAAEYDDDQDAKKLKSIVEQYEDSIPEHIKRLRQLQTADANRAVAILSTAHKAKGLEWPSIVVLDDFKTPQELYSSVERRKLTFDAYNQEINLIYTALTRGMEKCHLSPEMFNALKYPNDRMAFYEE